MAKKQFKAESKRLLDLMINSIYTHKEIFLREILSNASDAIDKLCYRSLTDETVGMAREDFLIRVDVDRDARTITVSDNGIGMTKEELEANLGVIASSGTRKFRDTLAEGEDPSAADVIGQMAGQCEEAAALAAPESYEDVPGSLSLAAQELRSASDGYREAFAAQYLDEAVLSDAQQHYANADTALRSALTLLRGGDEAEE